MANGEQGDIETLLALLIKSYPYKIAKQSMEVAGFSLLRIMEVHEAMERSILHVPINTYIRMQRITTNFESDKHFFHCISYYFGATKMIPHITKNTFETALKNALKYFSRQDKAVSVMYVKALKQCIHSIVKNLDLQEKLELQIKIKIKIA